MPVHLLISLGHDSDFYLYSIQILANDNQTFITKLFKEMTEETNRTFVSLVEEHKCVWNFRDPAHSQRNEVEKA